MIGAIISAAAVRRGTRAVLRAPVAPSWSVNPSLLSSPIEGASTQASIGAYSGSLPIVESVQWQTSDDSGTTPTNISGANSLVSPVWLAGDTAANVRKRLTVTLSGPGGTATFSTAWATVAPMSPPGSALLTIDWEESTLDGDGSSLTDLTGYRIAYSRTDGGAEPPTGATTVDVANPAAVTHQISGLEQGTWYSWIAAMDSTGPGPYRRLPPKDITA